MYSERSAIAERPVKPGSTEEAELLIQAAERSLPRAEGQAIRAAYDKARAADVDPDELNAVPA